MQLAVLKTLLAAVVVTTGALSPNIGKAETAVNVPFSFTVSGQTMPAGLYMVKQDTFHNMVTLRNQDASKSFTCTLQPGDYDPSQVRVSLKFESSGDSHVLRGIRFGSKTTSRLGDGPAPAPYEPARLSQGR